MESYGPGVNKYNLLTESDQHRLPLVIVPNEESALVVQNYCRVGLTADGLVLQRNVIGEVAPDADTLGWDAAERIGSA